MRVIKKYPNRRLYDTEKSAYITLQDVKQLVLDPTPFQVVDAKTGEDLTRSILLQIILELESEGVPMFNAETLKQIIRFYGQAMQGVMGDYLEKNMQFLAEMQNSIQNQSDALYQKPLDPETWTQFMSFHAPMMNNVMNNYLEQSKSMFIQIQEQMQHQTNNMFSAFSLNPNDKKS